MSELHVTNVRIKFNSFTIWIAFAGKLHASILLNIYAFTSQLKNPNYPLLFQN